MGDTTRGNGFESAAAAIEDGLETMMDKFNETVEERIRSAVDASIQQHIAQRPPTDSANASAERTIAALQRQIETLAGTVTALQKEVKNLAAKRNYDRGGNYDKENRAPPASKYGTWSNDIKWDYGWTNAKKSWYTREFKKNDPEGYKRMQRSRLEKQLKDLQE